MKRLAIFALCGMLLGAVAGLLLHRNARADPIVRHASIALPDWPAGANPVRVALLSDLHVGSSVMDGARLARIMAEVRALHPDLILVAGDFIAGHDPADARRAASDLRTGLAGTTAPLGMIAVLGNHEHWTDAAKVRAVLESVGVTVLENEVARRGPLAIGGVGDTFTHHDRLASTMTALRRTPGARVLLTHSPDLAPHIPADVTLLLAGHSHCGQIVLPFYGPVAVPLETGHRYLCGIIREQGRTVIVGAGLGTSVVPMRLNAPPDVWLITLHGVRQR